MEEQPDRLGHCIRVCRLGLHHLSGCKTYHRAFGVVIMAAAIFKAAPHTVFEPKCVQSVIEPSPTEVVLALAHIDNAYQRMQGLKTALAVELLDAVEYDDFVFHAAKVGHYFRKSPTIFADCAKNPQSKPAPELRIYALK